MSNMKHFWVKYNYIKADFDFGPSTDFEKLYPGKWTNGDYPRGKYQDSHGKYAGSHKIISCKSEEEINSILFDYEHKRNGFKCFTKILRCVEIKFNGLDHSDILVEVEYEIIITKLNKKGATKHGAKSKFGLQLFWDVFRKGHAGMKDKELIAFPPDTDPSEYNNAEALLKRLPTAPIGTKLEIKKFEILPVNK